jgi:hypothetical protein
LAATSMGEGSLNTSLSSVYKFIITSPEHQSRPASGSPQG